MLILRAGLIKIAILIALFSLLVACSKDSATSGENKRIIAAVTAEPKTLDPHDTTDTASRQIYSKVTETLVSLNEKGEIEPLLAEKWEVSDDGKVWTFYLRKDVKFHDDSDFNAEVVKANFDRVTNPDNMLARYSLLGPYLEKIEVKDEFEVEFFLNEPYAPFLDILSFPSGSNIISLPSIEEGKEAIENNPIGTAPFKLKEWSPGNDIVVEKFDDYWGEKAHVDEIVFKNIPESASRVLMLETGEIDIATSIPLTDIERLNEMDDINVVSEISNRILYVGINNNSPPFDKVEVRQALNYAVNKTALVENLYMGLVEEATAAIPKHMNYYSNVGAYSYDMDKAKELLEKAGVEEGQKIRMAVAGNVTQDHKAGEYVQNSLMELGFDVDLQMLELSDYLATLDDPSKYDLFLRGAIGNTLDPDAMLRDALLSDLPTNYARYSNPKVDELLKAGVNENDSNARADIYGEVLQIVKDDAPWIFLYADMTHVGTRNNIEDVHFLPNYIWDMSKIKKR